MPSEGLVIGKLKKFLVTYTSLSVVRSNEVTTRINELRYSKRVLCQCTTVNSLVLSIITIIGASLSGSHRMRLTVKSFFCMYVCTYVYA